jgi:hypothetical protein
MIPVDQTPLRRKTASECGRLMARVEKARTEWKRFENEDLPAFGRWMAASFGALQTRCRDLDALIHEKESLIDEVEEEMFMSGARPHTAYRRVIQRRTHPQAEWNRTDDAEPTPKIGPDFDPADSEGPDEFDQEMMFEEVLRTLMGVNPDKLDDATYEAMFRDFKRKVFGQRGTSEPPPFSPGNSQPKIPKPDQARIKEIYRVLVRRLHPDLRADGDAAVSSLWHEVQEAYSAGNLDRLETLLALTDIQSNKTGDHISLFQMHAVLAELERDLKALQKSLRRARKDDAWNFAHTDGRTALQARIRRELETSQAKQQQHLSELEALLDSWSQPPFVQKRKTTPAPRAQAEFTF